MIARQSATTGVSGGGAFLAGLVSGRLHRDDFKSWVKADCLIQPDESKRAFYDKYFELFTPLYTQTRQIVHDLS